MCKYIRAQHIMLYMFEASKAELSDKHPVWLLSWHLSLTRSRTGARWWSPTSLCGQLVLARLPLPSRWRTANRIHHSVPTCMATLDTWSATPRSLPLLRRGIPGIRCVQECAAGRWYGPSKVWPLHGFILVHKP